MTLRRLAVLCLLAATAVQATLPDPARAQTPERADLTTALDSAAAAHASDSAVAGVAVGVIHRGDTLLLDGYGRSDVEHGTPMSRDAVFEIGSITKQFTAAAILQLAARDSLDLDDDITEHVPDLGIPESRITIRHLLHHTSGLRVPSVPLFQKLLRNDLPRDSAVALLGSDPFGVRERVRLEFAPGTAMMYSNAGYFLLGLAVESASGRTYESYVEDHLFGPAGMEDSYYCDGRAVVENRAHGYAWAGDRGLVHRDRPDHTWPFAAGSLCSTLPDLVAWNRALHTGRILPDSLYRTMTTPGRLEDGTELRYAMGLTVLDLRGRRVIGHGGAINGFLSNSRYYPEGDLVVVTLQNTAGPRSPSSLAGDIAGLVLGSGGAQEAVPYTAELSALEGRYAGRGRNRLRDLRVEAGDGRLAVRPHGSDGEAVTLEHVDGLTWRDGADLYRFVRAGDRIVELRLDVVSGHYVLRRIRNP